MPQLDRRKGEESRGRSRSPRGAMHKQQQQYRLRSNSPHTVQKAKQKSHKSYDTIDQVNTERKVVLAFQAGSLSKHDLTKYRPLFASYLDIQKQIDIDELSEAEIKGRWKSFMGKWNRGELAEGWYDPVTLTKALDAAASAVNENAPVVSNQTTNRYESDIDDDLDYGPTLPHTEYPSGSKQQLGPTIPQTSDLALRDELDMDDRDAEREALQLERQADRTLQRERLEELSPRAEAGTKERQMEKKREVAASNRAFAESRGKGGGGGELEEVADKDLIGDEGGVEQVKRMRQHAERKKNEREIRREEMLRARAAEREERLTGLREREEQTMSMLKAIAKERFG